MMKKLFLILTCCLLIVAAKHKDEIDSLVDRLNHQPLWINGMFPELKLPKSATPEEVIAECLKMVGFAKGHLKWHNVVKIREVDIATAHPMKYSAALIDTDSGKKIILFRFEGARWWTRVFDVE